MAETFEACRASIEDGLSPCRSWRGVEGSGWLDLHRASDLARERGLRIYGSFAGDPGALTEGWSCRVDPQHVRMTDLDVQMTHVDVQMTHVDVQMTHVDVQMTPLNVRVTHSRVQVAHLPCPGGEL
ncbi:hypothetical protein [Sorangium cellulosum]|uniref:hypothetical protein n=1 Tax=Sorangium cellulosum TaxID=56 RepID=UPI001F417EEE|nr:hypothetical protein [Sorangium cellulosum]